MSVYQDMHERTYTVGSDYRKITVENMYKVQKVVSDKLAYFLEEGHSQLASGNLVFSIFVSRELDHFL